MIDYYPLLLRTVTSPGAGDANWRRDIYDHARRILTDEMSARRPRPPLAELAAQQAALEAAIVRTEAAMSQAKAEVTAADEPADDPRAASAASPSEARSEATEATPEPIENPLQLVGASWFTLPIVVVALAMAGYAYWAMTLPSNAPASKSDASRTIEQAARDSRGSNAGDLAPGVDGGSSDAELPYVFRRQATFYRTLQPVGTVIIDKLQHFLYLIQPNNVALRYGIGLGKQCAELAGLHRISNKAEWPPWQPPSDMVARKMVAAGTMPGGLGNPLGARVLNLDDGASRIHGTNAPKTIGSSVALGCIRLVNDDIVDLYNRVQVSTPVIAEN
jgi:lipoprotein-anchoring transpeptidase ErfK/SrfK